MAADALDTDDTDVAVDDLDATARRARSGSRKARNTAEQNDRAQWEAVRAVADRDRRRRGHDTTVRVRYVDPATLRPPAAGSVDADLASKARVAKNLRTMPTRTEAIEAAEVVVAKRRARARRPRARTSRDTPLTARVLGLLRGGPATATEIAGTLRVGTRPVTQALTALARRQEVVRTGAARRPPGAKAGRPSNEWRLS